MKTYKLDFYTMHSQFFLADKNSDGYNVDDEGWSEQAFADQIAIQNDFLALGTASYGDIKGEVHLLETPSVIDLKNFDHVVEVGLEVPSGVIQILDCPSSNVELELYVEPNTYRVRFCSSDRESAYIDEDNANDYYIIEIWPDTNVSKNILKRYTPPWKQ